MGLPQENASASRELDIFRTLGDSTKDKPGIRTPISPLTGRITVYAIA